MPTRRTLLVADDSPTVRKVVALTFEDEGFRVVAVASGAEAVEEIGREVPDVILADVHMPAPGGYELCARAKSDGRTRGVPVVLLVGAFEPFDEAEARSCGADGLLTKPFQSIRELVSKVGGLLGGQHETPHADAHEKDATTLDPRRDDAHDERAAATDLNAAAEPSATADAATNARPYTDFDMDDADIESVPAAEFDARRHAQPAETFADDAGDTFAAHAAQAEDFAHAVEEKSVRDESGGEPAHVFAQAKPATLVESEPSSFNKSEPSSFVEARPSSFVEAEPSINSSYEPSANTSTSAAESNSSANFSDESSTRASNEYPVSEPKVSAASLSDEPLVSPTDETPADNRHTAAPRDAADTSRAQGFEARADAAAAADDTLLELGDIDSPPARRDDPEDDFVLDFDDDANAFAPHDAAESPYAGSSFNSSSFNNSAYADQSAAAYRQPSYAAESYAEPSYAEQGYDEPAYTEPQLSEDAPSAVEMQSAGSVSMAEPSSVWDAAQEFTVSPDAVTEPVTSPAWQDAETSATTLDEAGVEATSTDRNVHAAVEPSAHDDAARDANALVSASDSGAQPAAQLSPETIEAIARRVVELLSDRAVREIAWEVVPDLAERLIRQKLEDERARQ